MECNLSYCHYVMDWGNLLILECVIIQEVKSSVHVFIGLGVPHSHILTFASQFLEHIKKS